jgi:acyl carrier protein
MDRTKAIEKATEIFGEFFDDDSITLRPEMTARDFEGWDSISNIRLMLSIEEAFNFRFETGEISELHNIDDLINAIMTRVG